MRSVNLVLIGFVGIMGPACASIFSTSGYDIPDESVEANMRVEVTDISDDWIWGGPIPYAISYAMRPDETERIRVTLLDSTDEVIGEFHLDLDWDGWTWSDLDLGKDLVLRVHPVTGNVWAIKWDSDFVMEQSGERRFGLGIRYVHHPSWARPSPREWKNRVLVSPAEEHETASDTM